MSKNCAELQNKNVKKIIFFILSFLTSHIFYKNEKNPETLDNVTFM